VTAHLILKPAGNGRVIDFDFESRPLWFWYEKPTAIITSVSYMEVIDGKPNHDSLTTRVADHSTRESYIDFIDWIARVLKGADILTGHNIDRFDLPLLQAQLMRHGREGLPAMLTQDTMRLPKRRDMSISQESLINYAALKATCPIGMPIYKHHLSIPEWEDSAMDWNNDLLIERPMSDVHGHVHLREVLIEKGYLAPPKTWRPRR
jgi:DNA polymerase elongation subunit (family B)